MKKVFTAVAVLLLATSQVFALSTDDSPLTSLMDGNKRFVSGNLSQKDLGDSRRKELAKGQNPSAIVLGCSDSRVSPELVFDKGLGEVFVIRTAGNIIDPIAIGSIEYAAEHLHTPLLVIMGHEKCGAVTSTIETKGHAEGNIGVIVKKILPSVKKAQAKGGAENEVLNNAIQENVFQTYGELMKKSPVIKHLVKSGKLKVVTAEYHLESGEVEVLAIPNTPQKMHTTH